ncbi:hypothetical protein [Halorhabdus amylolytica]|uniref:hypothetical protein n=1 Tax=Halorhabdus amylolytica TaxID=2559573 RepID=UPI0010AA3165|nr:hypothetical protein [Halorhabdus amylolytica]
MSATEDDEGSTPGRREVAYRLFAAEFDDADYAYSESDEERAPNYVITPTGARVNRVFAVGVLTEVQPAGEEVLRARIADPTGTFVVYAGQYQPDAQTFLERAEPPAYVAVTGKARTFQPEDSDVVYTSIRPESLNEVDEGTRDRWAVGAARQTLERVGTMATAMEGGATGEELTAALRDRGVPEGLAAGIPLALDHYGTTPGYLAAVRELAVSTAELVAGEREAVEPPALSPDQGGDADLNALAATATLGKPTEATPEPTAAASAPDDAAGTTPDGTAVESDATTEVESATGTETGAKVGSEDGDAPSAAESGTAESTQQAESGTTETASEAESGTTETGTKTEGTRESGVAETDTATEASPTTAAGSGDGDVAESDDSADKASTRAGREADESAPVETADEGAPEGTQADDGSAELGEFDGEFELDDEEREEIKSEFGTEFTSGTEVEEPGEAGIDTPEPESEAADEETSGAEDDAETAGESDVRSETSVEQDETGKDDEETTVDLEDVVMDAMTALDEGDGADRSAVLDRVSDEHGVTADEVEEAIQEALMNGRCYEPGEGTLKPI